MGDLNIDKAKEKAISAFLKSQKGVLSANEIVEGIFAGSTKVLGQAITLLESTNPQHIEIATDVVNKCLPKSGKSIRIGITGVPGVGKSTFIESFGSYLTDQGIKTAVLAIDPSSNVNKGSILGDKTRMENLSKNPLAFIRPSPSSGALGGVANATRESILLCESAGFEVIIVETVGVGQSEYLVKEMVDFFLLLMLSGAGDEIQGIKRGIMEMADALFVNKADGTNELFSQKAAQSYKNVLHLFTAREDNWIPETGTCSAIYNTGIKNVWDIILKFKAQQTTNGWLAKRRKNQSETWLLEQVNSELKNLFLQNNEVQKNMTEITEQVVSGKITPYAGSKILMDFFTRNLK